MNALPLNRKVLVNRLSEIERDIMELGKLRKVPLKEFREGLHFAAAEHHLRRALEAVFDAGNHILSRLPLAPSQRPESYKAIALALARHQVIPEGYARGPLSQMAGYRNRLVHFYDEVTAEELHEIIKNELGDLETFAKVIREVVADPGRLGLTIQ